MKVCDPISVGELNCCRLVNVDENGYKIIGIEHDEISMLSIDRKGKRLDKTLLYRLNVPEVYSIMDFKVSGEGTVAFGYVSEKQAGIIEIKNSSSFTFYCHFLIIILHLPQDSFL